LEDFIQAEDQQDGSPAPTPASPAVSKAIIPPLNLQQTNRDNSFIPLRLIILVPAKNLDTLRLAELITNLIHQNRSNLLLLSVVENLKDESSANSFIKELIELTSGLSVPIERKIVLGQSWVKVVKGTWQDGDVVICPAEQRTTIREESTPLGVLLAQASQVPVLMFEGYYHETHQHPHNRAAEVKWWGVALLVVAISSGFQIWIVRSIHGWPNPVLLFISFLVEYGFIWSWNRNG
jgi:hypothetical protein